MRVFLLLLLLFPLNAHATDDPFRSTPYPMPRFVSLASNEINVRAGPGERYPVKWVYHQNHRPVEIILEYDSWRKIRDKDGETGWVHSALLSGRRYGIATAEPFTLLHKKSQPDSPLKLRLAPDVVVELKSCESSWCHAEIGKESGWIERKSIWGVYEREMFD